MAQSRKTIINQLKSIFYKVIKGSTRRRPSLFKPPTDVSVFPIGINEEIRILELLKSSNGIDFKVIHIDDIPYYAILAKVRDLQKRGVTENIGGILGITEPGIEYLHQLINSNRSTTVTRH